MDDVLQDLYNSEINFAISVFWDGGFDVSLGDELNGWLAGGNCDTMEEVHAFLTKAVIRHLPNSTFAKKYSEKT